MPIDERGRDVRTTQDSRPLCIREGWGPGTRLASSKWKTTRKVHQVDVDGVWMSTSGGTSQLIKKFPFDVVRCSE